MSFGDDFFFRFSKKEKKHWKTDPVETAKIEEKYMKVHDAPELSKDFHCSTVTKPPRVGSTQLVNSLILTIQSKTQTVYRSNATPGPSSSLWVSKSHQWLSPNGSSLGTRITPLRHCPYHPCMVYLPTSTIKINHSCR